MLQSSGVEVGVRRAPVGALQCGRGEDCLRRRQLSLEIRGTAATPSTARRSSFGGDQRRRRWLLRRNSPLTCAGGGSRLDSAVEQAPRFVAVGAD
uniref:Uncharacterized protein n=1 Tax=Oryza meridionalis TaxID=40149 RepID=A0A0E0CGQ7_9ORYZ